MIAEEPDVVTPLVRFCEGRGWQLAYLLPWGNCEPTS